MTKEQKNDTDPLDWRDLITDDGVFAVDSRQRIVYWSDSAQRILGYRPEDVIGNPCYELVAALSIRAARGCFMAERHLAVEVGGLYWHFVDLVWIAVFTSIFIIQ